MLLSALVPLVSQSSLPGKCFLGREVYAFFLHQVEQRNKRLSAQLHGEAEVKPFTCSGLIPQKSFSQVYASVLTGEQYLLRITSIDGALSELLCENILPQLPDTIRLGEATFQVGPPLTQGHPLAGSISAEEMVDEYLSRNHLKREVGLDFFSPTAFRRSGRNMLMPLPRLLFRSYLNNWNAYCHPRFDSDFINLAEESVHISRFNLRTTLLSFKDHKEIGYLGRCYYTIFYPEPALCRLINLLADFAFFCGTGHKTTMGMGQTRRIDARPLPWKRC